jgi:hypothetical protein
MCTLISNFITGKKKFVIIAYGAAAMIWCKKVDLFFVIRID